MKTVRFFDRIKISIFTKVLLIFVGTGFLTMLMIWGLASHFLSLHDKVWESRNRNREYYANLVVDKIGVPPDLKKAQDIVDQTGMQMRIEGLGVKFVTPPDLAPIVHSEAQGHHCVWDPDIKILARDGRIFIELTRNGYTYLFSYENDTFLDERPEWWPMLVGIFLLALTLNYFAIRRIFKPLEWLSVGVNEVHSGQLNVQIKTGRNDELGDLTNSFNKMTREIARMLSSKEQLLLDVSHELRSPLTRIKVALELDDSLSKEHIRRSIRELESMISELLESARLDTARGGLALTDMSVNDLIKRAALKFQEQAPGVIVHPLPQDRTLHVDASRIDTVLKNILENAITYSQQQDKPIEIQAKATFDEVVIEVRDYGFGIPKSEHDLIFEPFYRVDKSRIRDTGGYGLGLALCKKIMQLHNAKIEVSSSEPQGTTFSLRFSQTKA